LIVEILFAAAHHRIVGVLDQLSNRRIDSAIERRTHDLDDARYVNFE
jgi:hypothetical protein